MSSRSVCFLPILESGGKDIFKADLWQEIHGRRKLRLLARHLVKAARRVFGIPDFRLYALADGIKHVLFNRSKGLGTFPRPPEPVFFQRPLFSP